MKYALVAVIALLAACFGNGAPDVAPLGHYGEIVTDPTGTTEVLEASDTCGTPDCPAFQPWRRIIDTPEGPIFWLVSNMHRACLISPAQFALAAAWNGRLVRCQWRNPRP